MKALEEEKAKKEGGQVPVAAPSTVAKVGFSCVIVLRQVPDEVR